MNKKVLLPIGIYIVIALIFIFGGFTGLISSILSILVLYALLYYAFPQQYNKIKDYFKDE